MDQRCELPAAARFTENGKGEDFFGGLDNQVVERCRQENARQLRFDFVNPTDRLDAVQSRHVHIQQHQMHRSRADDFERLQTVFGQNG